MELDEPKSGTDFAVPMLPAPFRRHGEREAVAGARVPVPTLEGRQWLTVPPGTPPGREFRIAGNGLPISSSPLEAGKRGALRVQVVVDMPTELTPSQAAAVLALEAQLGVQHFARAMAYRAAVIGEDAPGGAS